MANKKISAVEKVVLILGMLCVSVVLGLVIGFVTIDWWSEQMFEGITGVPALGIIVLPVAFLVPFFSSLVAQFCILSFINRSKIEKEN